MALRRFALAMLVALAPTAAQALGICRPEAARNDGYMRLLCEGENSLGDQQPSAAIEHFSAAAALPRPSASNELAWAGLAAAHCRVGDARAGRDWAQRFNAARRIWIGETPCMLDSGAPNPKIPQQVHKDLCTEAFVADYALIRASPQSAVAQDIRTRLDGVQKSVDAACGAAAAVPAAPTATAAAAEPAKKTTTTRKRKTRASGKAASPTPGK